MRSTTVGWLTSMVRVLPVTAENMRLNSVRPEVCDNIIHPAATSSSAPSNTPMISDERTPAKDPARPDSAANFWGRSSASDSWDIGQDYHRGAWVHMLAHIFVRPHSEQF